MRNTFKVFDHHAALFIKRRNGEKIKVLVDKTDLARLIELGKTWGVTKNGYRDNYFVQTTYEYKKNIKLHRFIMNASDDKVVVHLNGDPYDNRKINLKVVEKNEASRYRKTVNKNSSTGVRGVSWDAKTGRYKAYVTINRKQKNLGTFKQLNDAKKAVEEARRHYFDEQN